MELGDGQGAIGQGAEKFVEVGGVVEGVALDEDGQVGEGVVALGEMVEVGVGFAAEVGKRNSVRGALTFRIRFTTSISTRIISPSTGAQSTASRTGTS